MHAFRISTITLKALAQCWKARAALFCLVLAGCGHASVNRHSRVLEKYLDVIPDYEITYNGAMPDAVRNQKCENAFVFPSMLDGDPSRGDLTVTITNFLKTNNHFPADGTFSCRGRGLPIKIVASRGESSLNNLVLHIDTNSLKQVSSLDFPKFQELQDNFSDWLLNQGGSTFFTTGKGRFNEYETRVTAFWKTALSPYAPLPVFANAHPLADALNYTNGTESMCIWAIAPNGWLRIVWGGTAVYPFQNAGGVGENTSAIEKGVSRQTSSGEMLLQTYWSRDGCSVVPRERAVMSGKSVYKDTHKTSEKALPYPRESGFLLGSWIVPIFNEFDLHNDLLLVSTNKQRPTQLFLAWPNDYTKADPTVGAALGASGVSIDSYTAEARMESDSPSGSESLLRRCLIFGTTTDQDVKKYLDNLFNATKDSANNGFTAGMFNNQTSVQIVHYFSCNGLPWQHPAVHGSTWLQALSVLPPEVSARDAKLDVFRPYFMHSNGTQILLHFHLRDSSDPLLEAVKIADGDSFHTDL